MNRPIPGRDRISGTSVRPVVSGASLRPVGPVVRPVPPRTDDDGDPVEALWAAYRLHRSRSARDRLLEHYRPLVQAVAGRAASRLPGHVDPADLVQAGMFGLFEAVERYDPERCSRFENYAVSRIRGAVLDELRAQDWVPRTVRMRAREVALAREHLTVRLRRAATEREVADALHLAPRELGAITPLQLLSVELLCEGAGDGSVDPFADQGPDPAATALDRETHRQLWHAVAQLGDRDRLVVRLYYLENRTLAEIGRMLGVTESRICQLHSRLVNRLRGQLEDLLAAG
jgi:RNA polymerase sigma factor FliA